MNVATKIVKLRKAKGMTQSALGKELNVTYQAVSKWERDESQPDFDTICKIAKIFGVPISYFENDGCDTDEAAAADGACGVATERDEQSCADEKADMLGVCTACGRILRDGDQDGTDGKLLCKACAAQARAKAEKARLEEERVKADKIKKQAAAEANMRAKFTKRVALACAIGGLIALGSLITFVIGAVYDDGTVGVTMSVCMCIFVPIMVFTWVFQLFWDGVARSVTCWGLQVIKLPGIIFSADLDGLIFLIVMKILLTALSWIISILLICATSILGMIVSVFTFIPLLIKIHRKDEDIL